MKLHRATPELWPPSLNKTVPTQNARGHFRLDYWREVPLTKVPCNLNIQSSYSTAACELSDNTA